MKILVIDNTIDPDSWGSKELVRFSRLVPEATVHVRRAPHDDLPKSPDGYDRIIVSGSKTSAMEDAPWIDRLHGFIRRAVDLKKPYLGVCYGHQSLVRALGGKETVRLAAEAEYGWTRIELLADSPLTTGIDPVFYSFSAHFDEVHRLPAGMKRLARSADCEVQACQLENAPVFSIQFHPEKTADDARKTFADRRKKGTPKRLLHADETEKFYRPEIGETLFRNFFRL